MNKSTSLPVVTSTTETIGALIEDLCSNTRSTTTIIACCSRSRFLEQMALEASSNPESQSEQPHEQQRNGTDSERNEKPHQESSKHISTPLLQPTLRLIATSLHTNIVFCPDIPSFRAYVTTLSFREVHQSDISSTTVIVDMLAMHHGTSEFTVQGLSRTFAMLASVNHQMAGEMQIVECSDFLDPTDLQRGTRLWNADVPLLSGSVKIGEAGQGWASRTTNIKAFAGRWFQFQ